MKGTLKARYLLDSPEIWCRARGHGVSLGHVIVLGGKNPLLVLSDTG